MSKKKTPVPDFAIADLADPKTGENFRNLKTFLVNETPFLGFRFYTATFNAPFTGDIGHDLGFQPSDAIITAVSAGKTAYFNMDKASVKTVNITVSGACVVRFLLGSFV